MVDSEQHYRTLAFLAGFGAVGALGCDSVMEEEKQLPEVSHDSEALAEPPDSHSESRERPELTATEE